MDRTELEIDLFLESMKQAHGFDFSAYARASLRRRVQHLVEVMGVANIASLIPMSLHDEGFVEKAITTLTVSVSELFRDPEMFVSMRHKVLPYLQTFPRINVWIAGCASGEEAYSLAILLEEEGLLARTQIYATDICPVALEQARSGILRSQLSPDDARHYQQGGGKASLSDYFSTQHGFSKLQDGLLSRIMFAQHDMINESAIVSPQLLMCRNVLIYFSKSLQDRVVGQFYQSLDEGGFLVLAPKESLSLSSQNRHFEVIDQKSKIHQKRVRYA